MLNQTVSAPPVASSVDELVAGATSREPLKTADSLSGARFERLVIDGRPYVLKFLHVDDDWIQRCVGDVMVHAVRMWTAGLYDRLPSCIDPAIAGVAAGLGRNGWGAAILLHDVGPWLVPEGPSTIPMEQHRRFLDHMTELHATFWGFDDDTLLTPMGNRYLVLGPHMPLVEAERGGTDPVPPMVGRGWRSYPRTAPRSAEVVMPLLADPTPLTSRLATLPCTLIHSDWKAGNLGSHPDGRTILLDWAFPGRAPGTADLGWYLAVNCERLPESKEATIDAYRSSLESKGIDTAPWWDEAVALSLLGSLLHSGWSKSGDELAWWDERAPGWARYLD